MLKFEVFIQEACQVDKGCPENLKETKQWFDDVCQWSAGIYIYIDICTVQ